MTTYESFLKCKYNSTQLTGLNRVPELNSNLFEYQSDVVDFLLRQGRGAAFLDTGLGKTFIQLEWARVIVESTNKPVLILTPLAVGSQTAREAEKFGLEARVVKSSEEVKPGINITNYERMHLFYPQAFSGVVLDESSILKSYSGVTTKALINTFADTQFRLACTATPAPNDHMELGQHSAFLGVMASSEMLSRWFITDQELMGKYRLKGHAVKPFWDWVASWARCISKPSDLGYSDDEFVLPELRLHKHQVQADVIIDRGDALFRIPDTSATAIHREKRLTAEDRARMVGQIVAAEPEESWLIWCETDYEADALKMHIPDAIEVRGSMPLAKKEEGLNAFSSGQVNRLITKPSLAGFGLNWQHCARMAFIGLSFSYEAFYQAVRRCWRYGQKRPVDVHIVMADTERAIWDTINRKSGDHDVMKIEMTAAMARAHKKHDVKMPYNPMQFMQLPKWMTT